jgi:signal transduction histidine kinase
MRRFDTLVNRLLALLLGALILAQVVSVAFFAGQQEGRERDNRERAFIRQAETASRVLDGMPPDARRPSVTAFNGQGFAFHVEPDPTVPAEGAASSDADLRLPPGARLARAPDPRGWAERYLDLRGRPDPPRPPGPPPRGRLGEPPPGERPGARPPPLPPPLGPPREVGEPGPVAMRVAIPLSDGAWLNGLLFWPNRAPPWMLPLLVQASLTAVGVMAVVVILVRRSTRSLRDLAAAAHRLGRGEDVGALPEEGPAEIRDTVSAFNTMSERLRRMIRGRTRMLAAISHDLRTPITSLRIRAEMVEDAENRDRMLATLDEMQALAEASLTLAREDAMTEATDQADLSALVQSVCDDLADIGQPVTVAVPARTIYPCRVASLKRALRNLIDNAVKYGGRADVCLVVEPGHVVVQVDDGGPGIPPGQIERMFLPFVRLEESRSKETGGFGLGLSIARSIAQAHGGDVTLVNRPEGGLRARLVLPRAG